MFDNGIHINFNNFEVEEIKYDKLVGRPATSSDLVSLHYVYDTLLTKKFSALLMN